MPEGVETYVDGTGFATVTFVDPSLRGPALGRLHEIGGPESVETITREGPRRKYKVPEGNAREAGLIDNPVDAPTVGDSGHADALARQSAAVPGNPGLAATSRNANDAGPVEQPDVLGNQSVSTTESQTAAPAAAGAPLHAEVIATTTKAATAARKSTRKRAAELAEQRPARTSAANVNAALSAQTGALATDPQSRGGEGIAPVADAAPAEAPAAEENTETPAPASPSAPAPLDPEKDVSLIGQPQPVQQQQAQAAVDEPSADWSRPRIDAYAKSKGIDTSTATSKQAALQQIEEAKS